MTSRLQRFRPLAWPMAIGLSYVVLLRILVAIGAVQQVLGAVHPNLLLLAALLVLYVLRLVTLFVVPGWILVAAFRLRRSAARLPSVTNAPPR